MTDTSTIESARSVVEQIASHLDDLATRYLAYAGTDDNWANRAAEEAKARDAVRALLADHAAQAEQIALLTQQLADSDEARSVLATAVVERLAERDAAREALRATRSVVEACRHAFVRMGGQKERVQALTAELAAIDHVLFTQSPAQPAPTQQDGE